MKKTNCTVFYRRIPNAVEVLNVVTKQRGYSPSPMKLSRTTFVTFYELDTTVRKMLKNNNLYAGKFDTSTGYWSDIDYIDFDSCAPTVEMYYITTKRS